jgi:small neutral amino acid transporter SnatA (MarC family)
MIVAMASLDLADTFVTFLALLGPQKVLLSFARIARTIDPRSLRTVAVVSGATAAIVGAACELTAPWIATFFHIGAADVQIAAGLVFFIYAVGLVLGVHFDPEERPHELAAQDTDPEHPVTSGFRAMLLPFVVSPLAVAAALEVSLSVSDWGTRWAVAGAIALVAMLDAACVLVFAPLLGRLHENVLEVASRLLGLLLAAVGVVLFFDGLAALGILPSSH